MKRLLWLLGAVACVAHAAEPALQPGDYVTERGWGNLGIVQDKGGTLKFSIEAMGGNAHSCSLEGEIRDGRATLEAMDAGKPCVVTFKRAADGVTVASVDPQLCRYFCGMRADFEGKYLKTAAGCTPKPLSRTREEFKKLYDRRDYAAARAKLEPAFNACAKTLDWLETGWMRNDLALTQFRLGDAAACLRTLEPLAQDAAKSDAQIRDDFAPTDADNWLPVVKATRTNLKLCRTAAK
jgi:hypothetical protein